MSAHGAFIATEVREICEMNAKAVRIGPDFVADLVIAAIVRRDATGSGETMEWTARQHVKQVARAYLRRTYDPDRDDADDDQGEIFPTKLQSRYPTKPTDAGDSEYALRDHLSADDRWWNVDQLRKSAAARAKHADALQAETIEKFGSRIKAAA